MAEAHGYFGAYDYSLFTFGVNEEYAKRPKNYFFADSFTPEENLAEHFEIEVDKSIFALAKTRNPFFLPDLDALRFIDAGDTLTLYCGEESLHFETITDIDRSSSEESEDLPCKIDTKYKIIVSYSKESNLPARRTRADRSPPCSIKWRRNMPLFSAKTTASAKRNTLKNAVSLQKCCTIAEK